MDSRTVFDWQRDFEGYKARFRCIQDLEELPTRQYRWWGEIADELYQHRGLEFSGEFVYPSKLTGVSFRADGGGGDYDIGGSIRCPLFGFYWSAGSKTLRRIADWLISLSPSDMNCEYSGRELELSFHDGGVWWDLWTDDSGWTAGRPKWRDGNFKLLDFLFGREQHRVERSEEPKEVLFPMPERSYRGTVVMQNESWSRPRLPFWKKVVRRAHIEMAEPIPFPGKGTASYNCGEDAAHGMTAPAHSVLDAIAKMVASVTHDRLRYGGDNWRPEALR